MNRRSFIFTGLAAAVVPRPEPPLKKGDIITIEGVSGRYRVINVIDGNVLLSFIWQDMF